MEMMENDAPATASYSVDDSGKVTDSFGSDDFNVPTPNLSDATIAAGSNRNDIFGGGGAGDFGFGLNRNAGKGIEGIDPTYQSNFQSKNLLNEQMVDYYTKSRGATATNPFPESFFSQLVGIENVNYVKSMGKARVQELNELRARQAFNLPTLGSMKKAEDMNDKSGDLLEEYGSGDYYIGQNTNMGEVKPIPSMSRDILNFLPGGGIINALSGQPGLPEFSPRYQEIMNERAKSANDPTVFDGVTDYLKNMFGMGPKDSGASLAAGSLKEGQFGIPDNRTFDPFGNVQGSIGKFQSNISVPEGYETFINPYTGLEQMRKVSSGQPQGIGAFDTSNINPTSSININSPVRAPGRLSSEAMETARNQYSIPMSETVERDPKFEGFLSDTAFPPSLTSSNNTNFFG
tara:strand:+ start:129 stop:1340 length:1212 start_codon:yes stop_codon:yes gene_type:complete